jgi:Tol biopolymer transport system component
VDPLQRNPQLPAVCVPVVMRCLEKRPAERFQSARDLAFHLQQLTDASTSARARPARSMVRLRWVALAALAAAAAGAAWLARSWPAPTASFEQLTFRRARIGGARFASEEGAVIYSEAREGRPLEVWWLSGPGSPESRTLGYREADVLAVRSGKIALSLGRRFVVGERFVGRLAEAPIGEGTPHELLDGVEEADWDPQGQQLAITRSITVGGESRLEYPAGRPLYSTAGSIRFPRFSPDGSRIAFVEDPSGRGAGGVVTTVDLQAQTRVLSRAWNSVSGLAWSPRGGEVWFAAGGSRTNRALRAADLEGRERVILQAPASLTLCDVARNGRVLLARDEERSAIVGVPPGATAERDLSWFDNSGLADLSDDGQMLLFADRFGIYVRRTDGSPPIRLALSDGFADDISPDGRRVLATSATTRQLLILPVGLGAAEPVSTEGKATYRGALWLPDGKRILFNRAQPGEPLRSYVQALDGGQPKSITDGDTWVTAISPDAKWAAAIGAEGISLHPVDGGPHRVIKGSQPDDRPVSWSGDGRALWIFRRGQVPAEVSQIDIATGQRQLWKRLSPPDATGVYSITDFRVTPDGRSYAYSYKRVISQLYAAEGLR